MKILVLIFCAACILVGCAQLHHVQVGEIESSPELISSPFEIKVSETGIDLGEARAISKGVLHQTNSDPANDIIRFIQYFQMGPHTGAGVYSVSYVDHLENKIREQCPSGRITGLMSIRETAHYPVIKGEIIKIKGFCLKSRKENL